MDYSNENAFKVINCGELFHILSFLNMTHQTRSYSGVFSRITFQKKKSLCMTYINLNVNLFHW